MPLKLLNIEYYSPSGLLAKYEVSHSTPGREGTTVTQEITMIVHPGYPVSITMDIRDCQAPTPDEALTRLSGWLRRLADGIDNRGASVSLPLS